MYCTAKVKKLQSTVFMVSHQLLGTWLLGGGWLAWRRLFLWSNTFLLEFGHHGLAGLSGLRSRHTRFGDWSRLGEAVGLVLGFSAGEEA